MRSIRKAESTDKGHGRLELRRIETCSILPHGVNFPGAKQICRITRKRIIDNKEFLEIIFAITSLTRLHANAQALLNLSRGHWSIENRLHYIRDVSFGEDACTVSSGNAPQILASMRNACLFLIHNAKWKSVPKATRHFSARTSEVLQLVLRKSQKDF